MNENLYIAHKKTSTQNIACSQQVSFAILEAEVRTRNKLWHGLSILGYILTYSVLLRENIRQLWVFNIGTLIFLRPQCPVTRTHLRQSGETESCNILNCSNNKIICGNSLFCHNK